jgi:acetylornithine deacetylase/succinyl-diaminopimelate desuccinylase-like protein
MLAFFGGFVMEKALAYALEKRERFLADLIELLKIQSVSADPQRDAEVRRSAQWTADFLAKIGMDNAAVLETGGHPAVYADWLHAPGKPTILIYGHHDVQPEDPIDKWTTPPFDPVISDGYIRGRGTSDDKAQYMTHLFALEALLKTNGTLPCNIKVFIEGEEEGGKGMTHDFVRDNAKMLACDAVAISDTSWMSPTRPSIVYALRGIAYFEINVQGPDRDLHSGVYGGMVQNPLNAVGKLIASFQDADGNILVEGLYDDVVKLTAEERAEFASVQEPEDEIAADLKVPQLWGEAGYTAVERNWGRPSFDVHGIWGGFTGEGSKTVIAAEGGFKISFRLVANQEPEKIAKLVAAHVEKHCPPGVTATTTYLHGGTPVMVPADSAFIQAAADAFEQTFGKRPALVREGASIPITAVFQEALHAPAILVGYGLNEDNIHSPDEKFKVDHFYGGIDCNLRLYEAFAKVKV